MARFYVPHTASLERGDTIVEVLIAVGVLAAVLGSSAVVINRNIKTNMAIQERAQGIRLAERQMELFRVAARKPSFLKPSNGTIRGEFCMKVSGADVEAVSGSCSGSDLGLAAATGADYQVKITTKESSFYPNSTTPPYGRNVHVNVSWENVLGTGRDQSDLWAEVYSNAN